MVWRFQLGRSREPHSFTSDSTQCQERNRHFEFRQIPTWLRRPTSRRSFWLGWCILGSFVSIDIFNIIHIKIIFKCFSKVPYLYVSNYIWLLILLLVNSVRLRKNTLPIFFNIYCQLIEHFLFNIKDCWCWEKLFDVVLNGNFFVL